MAYDTGRDRGVRPSHRVLGTCPICLARCAERATCCRGCGVISRQLGAALVPVRPVGLARRGGTLHRLLVAYKAAPSDFVRRESTRRLALLLAGFLAGLGRGLGEGALHLVGVPSTGPGRRSWRGSHPLVGLVAAACAEASDRAQRLEGIPASAPACGLIVRGPGPLGHLRASLDAYRAVAGPTREPVVGRVLVVDDLYVSGAHAQSAARALSTAGFAVAAVVPIGRLVESDDERAREDDRRAAHVPSGR